jgi:hypothetical protein
MNKPPAGFGDDTAGNRFKTKGINIGTEIGTEVIDTQTNKRYILKNTRAHDAIVDNFQAIQDVYSTLFDGRGKEAVMTHSSGRAVGLRGVLDNDGVKDGKLGLRLQYTEYDQNGNPLTSKIMTEFETQNYLKELTNSGMLRLASNFNPSNKYQQY